MTKTEFKKVRRDVNTWLSAYGRTDTLKLMRKIFEDYYYGSPIHGFATEKERQKHTHAGFNRMHRIFKKAGVHVNDEGEIKGNE